MGYFCILFWALSFDFFSKIIFTWPPEIIRDYYRAKGSLGIFSIIISKIDSNFSTLFISIKYLTWWFKYLPGKRYKKEGTRLSSAVTVQCCESPHQGEDQAGRNWPLWQRKPCDKQKLVTVRGDGSCNSQIHPTPIVLSGSTTLGQAGHCHLLQCGLSSWSGSTRVELYASCIAVDKVKIPLMASCSEQDTKGIHLPGYKRSKQNEL